MKIKILIIHPALKLGVKPGLKAKYRTTQRVSVSEMKAIKYQEDRSLSLFLKLLVKGIFSQILMLFGKGLSLGFVLFLALSTLSFLNRGMDFLGSSLKKSSAGLSRRQSFQAAAPVSGSPYRVTSQPYSGGANTRFNKTRDARDAIRESGYFVSSVESFMRSLSRFSK